MPAINFLLNNTVVVKRRAVWDDKDTDRDSLNAPSYGTPDNWDIVYSALKCRIEYYAGARGGANIDFKPSGERVVPIAKMFVDEDVDVRPEDRVIDGDNIWIVEGRQIYYNTMGKIHHYEYSLLVP